MFERKSARQQVAARAGKCFHLHFILSVDDLYLSDCNTRLGFSVLLSLEKLVSRKSHRLFQCYTHQLLYQMTVQGEDSEDEVDVG